MMTKTMKFTVTVLLLTLLSIAGARAQEQSTEAVLQSFVESYKTDVMAVTTTFGIKVGNDWWYVNAERAQEAYQAGKNKQYTLHHFGPHTVTLHQGMPPAPTWYFEFADRATLDKIDSKIWTATTAAAKSTSADVTALDIKDMEGFTSDQKYTAIAYQVIEHFWKKDPIEITPFSRDGALPSHGVDMVALYTMKDKRIGWFSIGPEEAANADRGLEKGQVPNLFIFTKGRGKGQLGDSEFDIEAGMSIFIGPYVKHVIYNPYDEPLEGVFVLFGDNADFVFGQSYLDFLDKYHAFKS
ncbi:MAG: hypothetical protein H6574_22765 [Lewinellaceae bacterium]|nr:hypothetical protein [Lewinellaceae bacterium]